MLVFFLIDKIWKKMVHNHNHAGVKWGAPPKAKGAKYAGGGGANWVLPAPSCACSIII